MEPNLRARRTTEQSLTPLTDSCASLRVSRYARQPQSLPSASWQPTRGCSASQSTHEDRSFTRQRGHTPWRVVGGAWSESVRQRPRPGRPTVVARASDHMTTGQTTGLAPSAIVRQENAL
eukprot:679646-Prymnesium_polylepis.1